MRGTTIAKRAIAHDFIFIGAVLRILNLRFFEIIGLLIFTCMLAACGSHALTFSSPLKFSISGKVNPLVLQTASSAGSNPSTLACASAKASLYQLDSQGAKTFPALATSLVQNDGTYTFTDVRATGVKTSTGSNSLAGTYFVEITGCSAAYSRILTGFDSQDISFGSTVISSVAQTAQASNVVNADLTKVAALMNSMALYSDFSTAYSALTTNSSLMTQYQAIFGVAPAGLENAAPTAVNLTIPKTAAEHDVVGLAVTAAHWKSTYQFAYLWEYDGAIISRSPSFNWTPSGNSQGAHVLSVFYGQVDGSGLLDLSKPYGSQSVGITIPNNILPTVPTITLAGGTNVSQTALNFQLATGALLTNCDSFSRLAVTQDDLVMPLTADRYPYVCSQTPMQTLPVVLTGGAGTHVFRFWAMDASGMISTFPQIVNVNYSLVVPIISISSPVTAGPYKPNLTISGSCETDSGDVRLSGGISSSPVVTTCNSGAFSQAVVLSGADGSKVVTASQTNTFGNVGSSTVSVILDSTPPHVLLSTAIAEPTNNSSIPVVVTFDEPVTGFDASHLSVLNGAVSAFSGSGAVYNFNLVPSGQGTVSVNVPASSAQDAAGNQNLAAATLSRTFDTVAPAVALTSAISDPTNSNSFTVTVAFSKPVTGFNLSSLILANATASGLTGSGSTYTFQLNPAAQGSVSATLAAGAAHDAAGNPSAASPALTRVYDTIQPTVALSSVVTSPTNQTSIPVAVAFTKAVTGFSAAGIVATNATIANFSGSGSSYTFNLVPSGQGTFGATVSQGAAHDTAGNINSVSAALTRVFDTVQPTSVLSTSATSPTNLATISVTVTFSKAVTGFSLSDLSLSNATASGLTGSGSSYSFNLVPQSQGTFSASVGSSSAHDAAGNSSALSNNLSLIYDSIAPTVNLASTSASNTNLSVIPVTVTFSKSVTGFVASGLTLTNATVTGFSGSGTNYSFNLVPSSQGAVNVRVNAGAATDAAGNANSISTILARTFDSVAPIGSLSSTAADPTNVSPIPVSVTFNEVVTGFTASSIAVTNGVASGLTGSGTTYNFNVVPSGNGLVGVSLNSGAGADAAGNLSPATSALTRTFNNVRPTVTLTTTQSSPTNSTSIPVTVTFSSSVTGFSAANLSLNNATVSGFSGSGSVYTFSLVPTTQGAATVSVAAGLVQDSATNTNLASNTLSVSFDTTAPTGSLAWGSSGPTNVSPLAVTLTFSKSVTGFSLSGLQLTNATASSLAGSGTTYTFNLTPQAQGTVSVGLKAAAASDIAGNTNPASASITRIYDTTAPTVVITSSAANPTNLSSFPVSIVFSKSVTGVQLANFSVSNANLTGLSGSGTTYSATLTPSSAGSVSLAYPGGSASDAAGNFNMSSNSFSTVFDNVAPTVSLTTSASSPTNSNPIVVTVTFSKSVSGLSTSSLVLTNSTANSLSGSGTIYSFNVVPSGQGSVGVKISAGAAQDAAGNGNVVSNQISLTYDSVPPVLAFSTPAAGSFINLANQTSLSVSGSCSKAGSIAVAAGGISSTVPCTSSAFTTSLDLHTLSDGAVTITADSVDAAGNHAVQATLGLTKDTSTPTATLASVPTSPSKTVNLNVTVAGTNVSHYKFKVGASSSTDCSSASGYSSESAVATHITADISAISDTTIKVCVVGRNLAGNYQAFTSATSSTWLKDTVVTDFSGLTVSPTSPGNNNRPTISGATESSAIVQIYSLASCMGTVLGNGTATAGGAFSITSGSSIGSDGSYNFSLQATDMAGNVRCSSSSVAYVLDTVAPTIALTTSAANSTNLTSIPFTATFSEAVTGFSLSSITTVNGVASGLTGSGSTYSFNIAPTNQGNISVGVGASQAQDAAANGNVASSTVSRTYDSLAPVIVISSPASGAYFKTSSVVVSGTCESGLTINVGGTGISSAGTVSCSSGTFSTTLTFSSGDGAKNISLSQTDAAGNVGSTSVAVNYDTTPPVLNFTSVSVQNQNTKTNTVTFTGGCETGLSVVVAGGVDSGSTTCASGAWSYTTVSATSDGTRNYSFTQTDLAGNATAISGSWIRDTVAPIVAISSPVANYAAQTSVNLAGTCENGLGVVVNGAGVLSQVTLACSSGSYSAQIYFSSGDGAKAIVVSQTDLASNTTSVTRSFVRDTTPPAITQTINSSPYTTNTSTVTFGGACEAGLSVIVSGADTNSVACPSGTWSYTTGSQSTDASRTYTFTQTDSAGNAGAVSAIWVHDTTPPALTFTSSSSFLTSGNSVTFSGNCESGPQVYVTGGATANVACASGTWSYSPTSSSDGTLNFTFTQTDAAGNSSTINGSWQRSTSGPVITVTQTSPQLSNGSSLTISGTCSGGTAGSNGTIVVSGAASSSVTCTSSNSTVGSWTYSAAQSTDGTYNYTFTTTDTFTTPRSSSASLQWNRDTTPPQMTNSTFSINGGTATSTAVSYNPVSFSITDNISTVTQFCLKTNSTAPLSTDSCWYPVNGSATNVTPSNSIAISNYSYNVGIIPQAYTVYLWAMDGAGNISANANVTGKDSVGITITAASPPTINTVFAVNSTNPSNPPASSDTSVAGGSAVYLFWNSTAGSSPLATSPIRLYFTVDDVNWTEITSGGAISNAQRTGCTLISGSTGCYKWSSPTSNFFRVRALVADTTGITAQASSPAVNSGSLSVVAGNTDPGLGGSAKSAMFSNDLGGNARFSDRSTLVVATDGTIFFRDYQKGILKVDPATGKQTLFIPMTGSSTGDGGSALNATLRQPNFINMDFKGRLLIYDYNVIRRVDLSVNPPTISTIIGGGSDSTSDTLANPLSLSIWGLNGTNDRNNRLRVPFVVSPNNDIYFFSENSYPAFPYAASNTRLRIYKGSQSTPSIQSLYVTGTGASGLPNINLATCGNSNFAFAFNSSGVLQHLRYLINGGPYTSGNTACAVNSDSVGDVAAQADPTTGVAYGTITADPIGRTNHTVTGHDGVIYTYSRENGAIFKFTPDLSRSTGGTFTQIAGINGAPGFCVDGTAAMSCNITPLDVYVTAQGQVYFMDKGLVRTISSAGKIVTVMGQNFSFGDGNPAVQARFGLANSIDVHHVGGGTKVVIYDGVAARIREFSVGGNIATIAGNGNSAWASANSTPAVSQTLTSIGNHPWDYVAVDSGTGDVFATYADARIGRLVRSTGLWTNVYGGGSRDYSVGDGYSGSTNGFVLAGQSQEPITVGTDGTNVATFFYEGSTTTVNANKNPMLKLFSLSSATQSSLMGTIADPASNSQCGVGTASTSCNVPSWGAGGIPRLTYDSVNTRWLFAGVGWTSVSSYVPGGNRQADLVSGLNPSIQTFAYSSSANTVYYCGNGRLYKVPVGGAATALTWPITSMSCTGYALIYDSTSNALYFPFTQNGLFGVGMYANP